MTSPERLTDIPPPSSTDIPPATSSDHLEPVNDSPPAQPIDAPHTATDTRPELPQRNHSSLSIESPETASPDSLNDLQDANKPSRGRHRVQWNRGGETIDTKNQKTTFELPSDGSSDSDEGTKSPPRTRSGPRFGKPLATPPSTATDSQRSSLSPTPARRPPILRKTTRDQSEEDLAAKKSQKEDEDTNADGGSGYVTPRDAASKALSAQSAQQRAEKLSRSVGIRSAPGSRTTSPHKIHGPKIEPLREPVQSPPASPSLNGRQPKLDFSDIPLERLLSKRNYGIEDESEEDDDEDGGKSKREKITKRFQHAAESITNHHGSSHPRPWFKFHAHEPVLKSGQTTPIAERDPNDYVPRPRQYRAGALGSLMKLRDQAGTGAATAGIPLGLETSPDPRHRGSSISTVPGLGSENISPTSTPFSSISSPSGSPLSSVNGSPGGSVSKPKPAKWHKYSGSHARKGSIAELVSSSTSLAQPGGSGPAIKPPKEKAKPLKDQALDTVLGRRRSSEAIRIQIHLADTLQRKAYLLKICYALMLYGAPTHRLEEYMRMSARVLETDAQFLYMPGCMIISFGDTDWHTTDVRIVRCAQTVNLSKLYDTHAIYKEVIHDMIGVEEAMSRLHDVTHRPDAFPNWFLVIIHGLAALCVGPFAFGARPIDLPVAFILGSLLGFMQLILAPRSELYSNIFEISAAVLTSFLARAFGSIAGGSLFCFSSLAQSSIALILPGYTVLCGSLELQSRNIVAGSVRMVYAVIYSLFLGFGITVGTAIYGAIDPNSTTETVCQTSMPFWWKAIFVMPFTLCLTIINQTKWSKVPPMLALAMVGYLVNYFSAQRFASNAQIAQTLGALAIGVLANLYSRIKHGLAAAVLLPAIFVQVPSGLAASGSLISGVTSANQLLHDKGKGSNLGGLTTVNGTMGNGQGGSSGVEVNSAVLNVGYSMIQIAIGITVGLFMSALFVYPLGKRRSGLFSF